MPVGNRDTYFLRGAHPDEEGSTLEQALSMLLLFWDSRRSLAVHEMGNLVVEMNVLGRLVSFEVTNPAVLEDLHHVGPIAVLEYLARATGLDRDVAMDILAASSARVRVDCLQVPDDPTAWRPGVHPVSGAGAEDAEDVMAREAVAMLSELVIEQDQISARAKSRRRTTNGDAYLREIVRVAREKGLSDAEVARRTGLPRTTIRDARHRTEREGVVRRELARKAPRAAFRSEQREAILREVTAAKGNASEAARRMGVSPRTVREMRQRAVQEERRAELLRPGERMAARTRYTPDAKAETLSRILGTMREKNLTASEAARENGVRDRTGRQWVREFRRKDLKL